MGTIDSNIVTEITLLLANYPKVLRHWEKLSPSHKKEYINWIDQAKKEETRQKRKEKAVEMLIEKYS